MKELLFAYGSMKRDFANHYRLQYDRFMGKAITCKNYNMYPVSTFMFPYMIEDENIHPIKGELYELTHSQIKSIDQFEGTPNHYYRKEIEVQCEDKIYKAYAYFRSQNNLSKYEQDLPMDEWTKEFNDAGHFYRAFLDVLGTALQDYEYKKEKPKDK